MSGQGNKMSSADAARIQSTQVSPHLLTNSKQQGGKDMGSDGFAARAQGAVAGNANAAAQQGQQGQASNKK